MRGGFQWLSAAVVGPTFSRRRAVSRGRERRLGECAGHLGFPWPRPSRRNRALPFNQFAGASVCLVAPTYLVSKPDEVLSALSAVSQFRVRE